MNKGRQRPFAEIVRAHFDEAHRLIGRRSNAFMAPRGQLNTTPSRTLYSPFRGRSVNRAWYIRCVAESMH